MTYTTLATAAAADTWIARVKIAIVEAAIAIAVDSPSAGVNTRRDKLARSVLQAPDFWAQRMALGAALGFLAEADLGEVLVTDAELASRISSIWNDYLEPS